MWLKFILLSFLFFGCASVRQDERGVIRTFGKLDQKIHTPGLVWYNPFISDVIKVPVRTVNKEVQLSLPSKEGTTIQAEISILYRVQENKIHEILQNVGEEYEPPFVQQRPMFPLDTLLKIGNIGNEIAELMNQRLYHRGFEIEGVMLKSIVLPAGLARSIEEKL